MKLRILLFCIAMGSTSLSALEGVQIDNDGAYAVVSSYDKDVYVYHEDAVISSFRYPASVCALALAPDGRHCAVGLRNGWMYVYSDIQSDEPPKWIEAYQLSNVDMVAFSKDSELLASMSQLEGVSIYSVNNLQEVSCINTNMPMSSLMAAMALECHHKPMASLATAMSFDCDNVLSVGFENGKIYSARQKGIEAIPLLVDEVERLTLNKAWTDCPPGRVYDIAFSSDGRSACSAHGAMLRLWDMATKKALQDFKLKVPALSVVFDSDAECILAARKDRLLKFKKRALLQNSTL